MQPDFARVEVALRDREGDYRIKIWLAGKKEKTKRDEGKKLIMDERRLTVVEDILQ
jgi:hypothetical protein